MKKKNTNGFAKETTKSIQRSLCCAAAEEEEINEQTENDATD